MPPHFSDAEHREDGNNEEAENFCTQFQTHDILRLPCGSHLYGFGLCGDLLCGLILDALSLHQQAMGVDPEGGAGNKGAS